MIKDREQQHALHEEDLERESGDGDSFNNTTVDGIDIDEAIELAKNAPASSQHHALKHHLLGPSLGKAGQDGVDQKKVAEVIYEASKGSKYFNNEEVKDKNLAFKIDRILKLKAQVEHLDLRQDLRRADNYITELELSRDLTQYVVHIDCDAFYAAVEEIDRPELKNVPMAVGQGVLTTCNYEARKYGCRSAMAGFVAKKLCPQLICLPLRFEKYTAKAKEVRAVLAEYDPTFQSSSIDEAYLNITEYCNDHRTEPEAAVEQLRNEVHEKCKITISAGIAPNAKIAKICSNKNKPNGQFRVSNDRMAIMSFMKDLSVRKVNGVGRVLERELDAIGVKTCGDIYEHRAYLHRLFGEKVFQFLMQTYLGLGRTDIRPAEDHERKSVGTESTFREMSNKVDLREKLRHTAEELEKDLKRVGVKGRTLVLKVKLHTYEVFTRQTTPPKAVHLADDLYNYSLPMLAKLEKEMPIMKLRLMGLRCTHLVGAKKADVNNFFGPQSDPSVRQPQPDKEERQTDDQGGEWEVWPDEEFEEAARQERQEEMEELERLSQEHTKHDEPDRGSDVESVSPPPLQGLSSKPEPLTHEQIVRAAAMSTAEWHEPFGIYKYGSETRFPEVETVGLQTSKEQERWTCPICQIPQPANDREFNMHIDSCLSKQTIRDVVAEAGTTTESSSPSTTANRSSTPQPQTLVPVVRSSTGVDAGGGEGGGGRGTNTNRPPFAQGTKRKATSQTAASGSGRQKKLFFT